MAHSAEEEAARNFVRFGGADVVTVVCDATCLERNLNLVLQIMETGIRTVLCVNLMDEAKRKDVAVDIRTLSQKLGIPVVGVVARDKSGLDRLLDAMDEAIDGAAQLPPPICYPRAIEEAAHMMETVLEKRQCGGLSRRWLALRLFDMDESLKNELTQRLGKGFLSDNANELNDAKAHISACGISQSHLNDEMASAAVNAAEKLCRGSVSKRSLEQDKLDRRLDEMLTGRRTGYPAMAALLALVFTLRSLGQIIRRRFLQSGSLPRRICCRN